LSDSKKRLKELGGNIGDDLRMMAGRLETVRESVICDPWVPFSWSRVPLLVRGMFFKESFERRKRILTEEPQFRNLDMPITKETYRTLARILDSLIKEIYLDRGRRTERKIDPVDDFFPARSPNGARIRVGLMYYGK